MQLSQMALKVYVKSVTERRAIQFSVTNSGNFWKVLET